MKQMKWLYFSGGAFSWSQARRKLKSRITNTNSTRGVKQTPAKI